MNPTTNPTMNPTMKSKHIVFLPLAFVVVFLDQLGKFHVARTIETGTRVPLIGDLVAWTHIPAAGGAFGFFQDWAPAAQLIGFALLSIIAILVIATFYRGLARGEHGSAAALGAILGGIVSNTVDRVRYGSGVDFLHLGPVELVESPLLGDLGLHQLLLRRLSLGFHFFEVAGWYHLLLGESPCPLDLLIQVLELGLQPLDGGFVVL